MGLKDQLITGGPSHCTTSSSSPWWKKRRFHEYRDTPIAGWFFNGKSHLEMDDWGGYTYFRKPPYGIEWNISESIHMSNILEHTGTCDTFEYLFSSCFPDHHLSRGPLTFHTLDGRFILEAPGKHWLVTSPVLFMKFSYSCPGQLRVLMKFSSDLSWIWDRQSRICSKCFFCRNPLCIWCKAL